MSRRPSTRRRSKSGRPNPNRVSRRRRATRLLPRAAEECRTESAGRVVAAGALDIVVSNAGQSLFGSAEETSIDEARQLLDVNLFGLTVDPVAATLEDMGVPFLFCTGYQAAGATGVQFPKVQVLTKPVNAHRLLSAVGVMMAAGPRR